MTAQATPVSINGTGNTAVSATPATYRGHAIREAAGSPAAAAVRIWDNTNAASGTLLATMNLAASGTSHLVAADGVRATKGIYVEVVSGTVEGCVWVG